MKTRRPPVVWITQIVLAISAALFGMTFLGVVLVWQGPSLWHIQMALLVALPIAAFVGLARGKLWGREMGLLSLACLWAYVLHGYWSSFGDWSLARMLRTPRFGLSIIIFLILVIFVLPCLFGKLRWGSKETEFFED